MKPKTFGEAFITAASLVGVTSAIALGMLLFKDGERMSSEEFGGKMTEIVVISIFIAIAVGVISAYRFQGETIVKDSDDPKKMLQTLVVRLAESGYNLETQTEALHTFKPPFYFWVGGRIYILSEEKILRIVGPTSVLKKLRDV